jgi:hypothetical protein
MKNIVCVNQLQKCGRCEIKGFFCYTPYGGGFTTCPCCGENDFLNTLHHIQRDDKYDFLYEDEFDNDMRNLYSYCKNCKIIYELGCDYCYVGCTDGIYNCHFIKKWKHKKTNIEYEGMPMFDDENDWFDNVNNVEILNMYCPHKGSTCIKTIYKINEKCKL